MSDRGPSNVSHDTMTEQDPERPAPGGGSGTSEAAEPVAASREPSPGPRSAGASWGAAITPAPPPSDEHGPAAAPTVPIWDQAPGPGWGDARETGWGQAQGAGAGWDQAGHPAAQPGGGTPPWGGAPPGGSWGGPAGGAGAPPAGRTSTGASRRRAGQLVVAGALALALAAGGYAFGVTQERNSLGATSTAGVPAPASAAPGPVQANSAEPVAAVAKILLPSVVQINTSQGLGSGVIHDSRGYILTAAHVVGDSTQVQVQLGDGTRLPGRVLGREPAVDTAVVKVDKTGLPAARLATGVKLQVGQMAVAIGSPFRLQQSVTAGVVSAVDRAINNGQVALQVVQTDAPINPGNSGGALADRQGRVIGINDSIESSSGGNEGIGFAIPIDTAAAAAGRIVRGEAPKTTYLGVSLDDASGNQSGALVSDVQASSPADRAGLRPGDLVVAVDGQPVDSAAALAAKVRTASPGQKVNMTVVRNGQRIDLAVTLEARPS